MTSDYTATGYVEAIIAGDTAAADTMREDILAVKVANGQTEEAAQKAFASNVAGGIRDNYSAGLLDEAAAENMLVEYTGMKKEDAAGKVRYWAFCNENPEYSLSEANVDDYYEFAEPEQIPLDVFWQYVSGTKGITEIYDEWGDVTVSKREQILDVIHSLPLTWEQKDALYLAAGYSQNKIWDVPW